MISGGENKPKHPGGRPPRFSDPAEMQSLIDAYFAECDAKIATIVTKQGNVVTVPRPEPYTIPGLAYALGFSSRQTLLNYEGKPEFMDTLKRAKLYIERQRASSLVTGTTNPAGGIFDLKNNFGWKDQQEVAHTGANGEPMQFVLNLGAPPMQQIPGPVKVIECGQDEDES